MVSYWENKQTHNNQTAQFGLREVESWIIKSSQQSVGRASFLMFQELQEIQMLYWGPGDNSVYNII
jgi:hypothetical protein